MPHLKNEIYKAVKKKFNIELHEKELNRFNIEIGFIALESILDTIKSIESKSECLLYLENLDIK